MEKDSSQEDMKLRLALRELPKYSPGEDLWLDIVGELVRENRAEAQLQQTLPHLPTYEAPLMIWENIETTLPSTKPTVRVFSLNYRWAAAATVIGLAMMTSVWWFNNRVIDSVAYRNSTEVIDEETIRNNQATNPGDEVAFAKVNEICETQAFICEQPHIKQLKSELDELNTARLNLKEALGNYGTDRDLQQRLLSIEQERTDVLKKIMETI